MLVYFLLAVYLTCLYFAYKGASVEDEQDLGQTAPEKTHTQRAIINHRATDTWLEFHIGEYVEVVSVNDNILTFKIEGYKGEQVYPLLFFNLISD